MQNAMGYYTCIHVKMPCKWTTLGQMQKLQHKVTIIMVESMNANSKPNTLSGL